MFEEFRSDNVDIKKEVVKDKKNFILENFDYKLYRKNAATSLKQVEYFLNNFQKISTSFRLYKLFK